MHHATPLITTIVGGLVLAFILGMIANKLAYFSSGGISLSGRAGRTFHPWLCC